MVVQPSKNDCEKMAAEKSKNRIAKTEKTEQTKKKA
jgi:hypothetical protein